MTFCFLLLNRRIMLQQYYNLTSRDSMHVSLFGFVIIIIIIIVIIVTRWNYGDLKMSLRLLVLRARLLLSNLSLFISPTK